MSLNSDVQVAAAILAGGQSSRMGKPKAMLDFKGKPLIEHLAGRLREECDEVFIAGCPQADLYRNLSLTVLTDREPNTGPLGGIATALKFLAREDVREKSVKKPVFCHLLVVPCDGFPLPDRFGERMYAALETGQHELVFARDAEREQPLYALLKTLLLPNLEHYLRAGGRKVIDWMKQRDYAVVDFSADGFRFSNLNTPHDWQTFLSAAVHHDAVVRPSGGNGSATGD